MVQTDNTIYIEGLLNEIDIKSGSFEKDGKTKEYLSGVIKVIVDQEVNGKLTRSEIPVNVFATKFDNKGNSNKAYESIEKVTHLTSVASCGDESKADYVRISKATLKENAFYAQGTELVSFPRIEASFINRISKEDAHPKAVFSNTIIIGGIADQEKGGEITGAKIIKGLLVQFGGKVDVVEFIVKLPEAITYISKKWSDGDVVVVKGLINFSTDTSAAPVVEVEFGEAPEMSRSTSVRELLVTGGSAAPVGDGYTVDEINAGLAERRGRLEELKNKKSTSGTTAPASKLKNIGF